MTKLKDQLISDLQEEVLRLKRKLMVAEGLRHEASLRGSRSEKSWDARLLASGVAHEFNNILGAADGHAEWALDTQDPRDMKEALEIVRQACLRSQQITRGLQGLPHVNEEEAGLFNLKSIERDLKQFFAPKAKLNKGLLKIEMPDLQVYGSEARLFEVLFNLIKNSIEADAQSVCVSGKSELQGERKVVRLWVEDDGEGIPEALIERVFEPFFTTKGRMSHAAVGQHEAEPQRQEGCGLGLYLSRSLIEEMGGELLHVTQGVGCRFELLLPALSEP